MSTKEYCKYVNIKNWKKPFLYHKIAKKAISVHLVSGVHRRWMSKLIKHPVLESFGRVPTPAEKWLPDLNVCARTSLGKSAFKKICNVNFRQSYKNYKISALFLSFSLKLLGSIMSKTWSLNFSFNDAFLCGVDDVLKSHFLTIT